jgi:hypothetical protein
LISREMWLAMGPTSPGAHANKATNTVLMEENDHSDKNRKRVFIGPYLQVGRKICRWRRKLDDLLANIACLVLSPVTTSYDVLAACLTDHCTVLSPGPTSKVGPE